MESIQNLVEYYDELYPVTEIQKKFYDNLVETYSKPVRFLNIGCGTGVLENRLAKETTDVTGLETIKELLESASRKRRNQLMCVRFFQMSTLEMVRFLGKKFYNVISCLNDRLTFIHDTILLRKFFFDCKQLIADDGCLILGITNYDLFDMNTVIELPELSSMRVRMKGKIEATASGEHLLSRHLITASNKTLPVYSRVPVYPLRKAELLEYVKEAGFSTVDFYSDFDLTPAKDDTPYLICIVR